MKCQVTECQNVAAVCNLHPDEAWKKRAEALDPPAVAGSADFAIGPPDRFPASASMWEKHARNCETDRDTWKDRARAAENEREAWRDRALAAERRHPLQYVDSVVQQLHDKDDAWENIRRELGAFPNETATDAATRLRKDRDTRAMQEGASEMWKSSAKLAETLLSQWQKKCEALEMGALHNEKRGDAKSVCRPHPSISFYEAAGRR